MDISSADFGADSYATRPHIPSSRDLAAPLRRSGTPCRRLTRAIGVAPRVSRILASPGESTMMARPSAPAGREALYQDRRRREPTFTRSQATADIHQRPSRRRRDTVTWRATVTFVL